MSLLPCTNFSKFLVQHFVGFLRWPQRHCQVPTTRCRREVHLLPCSWIKAETLPLWPKTNPSSRVFHLGDSHQRSTTVDSSTFNDHRLSRCVQGAQDSLSFVIHFVFACSARMRIESPCGSNTLGLRGTGWTNRLACSGVHAKCDRFAAKDPHDPTEKIQCSTLDPSHCENQKSKVVIHQKAEMMHAGILPLATLKNSTLLGVKITHLLLPNSQFASVCHDCSGHCSQDPFDHCSSGG